MLIRFDWALWLETPPSPGLWGGLQIAPVFPGREAAANSTSAIPPLALAPWPPSFLHVLTHRDLHLHPLAIAVDHECRPSETGRWFQATEWPQAGLPAPMRKILEDWA